jgi:hypothetical protein
MNFGRRIVGGVGDALDRMTATPEARLATQIASLNLLRGGSGNGLVDFSNAAQTGLATYQQAMQQKAQNDRANQQLELEKQNLELNKKRLANEEQANRARGYASAAEYQLNKDQLNQRQNQWNDELKLRREEMMNRLQIARTGAAGRGGENVGAQQNAANDIASAIQKRYPNLDPAAAKLLGWQVFLTRGQLGIKDESFDTGQAAMDYYMSIEKSRGLMEDWASNPQLRTKAKQEAIQFAQEMERLSGVSRKTTSQDVMSRLDSLVSGEPMSAPSPGAASPAAGAPSPATGAPGSPPQGVEPGTPSGSSGSQRISPVTARGSGYFGLSTTQNPSAWVGRSTIVQDPNTKQDTLLRLLEATPGGFRAKRDSDGAEDIITYEEMNSEGWWERFKK